MKTTPEEVRADALGAMGWLAGYTEPTDGRPQRRVTVVASDNHGLTVVYEPPRYSGDVPEQRFVIRVEVEEVTRW